MSDLVNHEAVCRTTPATPGLLNIDEDNNYGLKFLIKHNRTEVQCSDDQSSVGVYLGGLGDALHEDDCLQLGQEGVEPGGGGLYSGGDLGLGQAAVQLQEGLGYSGQAISLNGFNSLKLTFEYGLPTIF